MRSVAVVDDGARAVADDRTARARIRDAAIACFADHGVDGTSIRTIAKAAGVSPGLVIHHFGSKEGLRIACDEHVNAVIRTNKRETIAQGVGADLFEALRRYADAPPMMRYLARTLADGSPQVAVLVDEMVRDAVAYLAEGERTGMLRPSEAPHTRAALLTIWSLGALVLHEHVKRLLDADLVGELTGAMGYARAVVEVIGPAVFTEDAHAWLRTQTATATHAPGDATEPEATERGGTGGAPS